MRLPHILSVIRAYFFFFRATATPAPAITRTAAAMTPAMPAPLNMLPTSLG